MMSLYRYFKRWDWRWFALALVCGLAATASVALTAWLRLDPCHLCIFQRLLFILMTPLALLALVRAPWGALAGGAFACLALAGALTAAYQTWLQLQPPGAVSCMGAEMGPIERLVEWLGMQWPALFMASGFCEDRELVILGLSLANWALALYLAVLMLALWSLLSRRSGL